MRTKLHVSGSESGRSDAGRLGRRNLRRALLGFTGISAAIALTGCALLPPFGAFGGGDTPEQSSEASSFVNQEPEWTTCHEDGLVCADVEAPLDWADPEGETITLSLIKREAEGTKLGSLFRNPGGPGISGVDDYSVSHPGATGIAVKEHYDVISWDTRGVAGVLGNSTPVKCLDTAGLDDYLYGGAEAPSNARGSEEWVEAKIADAGEFSAACAERTGDLLAHVDTRSTVQDLEMLRQIVGDEKLNYLGEDYGTYIGALYADTYPDKVGRMVLDGALDPSVTNFEVSLAQAAGMERMLRVYVEDCLKQTDCPLTGTTDEALQSVRTIMDTLDAKPGVAADGRPVSSGTFLNALLVTLTDRYAWIVPGYIFDGAVDGDYANVMEFADMAVGRYDGEYTSNYVEAFAATTCLDMVTAQDPAKIRAQAAEIEAAAPTLGSYMAYSDIECAEWPYPGPKEATSVTATGAQPILVLSATDDPVYPHAWSESLADQLESAELVSFVGESHGIYGTSPCVNTVVNEYFMEGTVPAKDPQCTEADDEQMRADGYDGTSQWPLELDLE